MNKCNIFITILLLTLLIRENCEAKLLVDNFIEFFKSFQSTNADDALCEYQFKYFLDGLQQNEMWALECKYFPMHHCRD